MSANQGKNSAGQKESEPILFRDVESSSEEISGRARTIAIWVGLFICAIVVSQFGRPSRAREREFLRGAAKVEALGQSTQATPGAKRVHDGGVAAMHGEGAKEVTPAIYVSKKYGVAWQYPRTYVLRKGANANLNLAGQTAAASAFAGAGGVTLATVSIPARLYPNTDFKSASFTVRVNPHIGETECGQIKISAADGGDGESFPASQITVGTIDFVEADVNVEDESGAPGVATLEKFYHAYDNDACYEFAMSASSGGISAQAKAASVDRDDIFDLLTEILTSVTIVPRNGYVAGGAAEKPNPR
ncbi:MAG TPA: hypothetical protein VKF79_00515 [Candidatus Acidoferrum sp.]|nr:hypothetical protein [Candidatus Acidoferrum sp.]